MRFESVFGFGFGGAFTLFADCLNTLALGQKMPEAFRGCKMMIVFARRALRRAAWTSASEELPRAAFLSRSTRRDRSRRFLLTRPETNSDTLTL